MPKAIPASDIIRALDTKYLNREIPPEVYLKLRSAYEAETLREQVRGMSYDAAYQ